MRGAGVGTADARPRERGTMRILHVLDHSLPLHSGYAFRTLAILREQRALGWETLQLTTPQAGRCRRRRRGRRRLALSPHAPAGADAVGAPRRQPMFRRWPRRRAASTSCRESFQPDILHAHSPVLNAMPALRVGRRRGIPVVYEVRAFWEDAAVDHGTTTEGSAALSRLARARDLRAAPRRSRHDDLRGPARRHRRARHSRRAVTVIPNAVDIAAFRSAREPDAALRTQARPRRRDGARLHRLVLRLRGPRPAARRRSRMLAAAPSETARAARRRRPAGSRR